MWNKRRQQHLTIWLIIFSVVCATVAGGVLAQTPPSEPPPPQVTDVPVATETPVPTVEPVATEAPTTVPTFQVIETQAPVGTESPSPTEVETDDSAADVETPTPTSGSEVSEPDELLLNTAQLLTIGPGEYSDVVTTYVVGSSRNSTLLTATLSSPGSDLQGWALTPVQRADLLNDPADPDRDLKARVQTSEGTSNGDSFETVWRMVAPSHIESTLTLHVSFASSIDSDDGVTEGVVQNDLVSINASPSGHNPTMNCSQADSAVGDNDWNCVFVTSHPNDDVIITASSVVPEGWELNLNGVTLTATPVALGAEAIAASSFSLSANYPYGCPESGVAASASITLAMTYPSGELVQLQTELSLLYEKPKSMLEISSFGFNDLDLRQTQQTTGHLTMAYEETPCSWQATIQLTDLESEDFAIPSESIRIGSVEGLPNATVTFDAGVLTIRSSGSEAPVSAGEFTIHFVIELSQEIPPGAYRIGIDTQFMWLSEL